MSSAKKRRELNRAIEEHDRAKLSAQFAAGNHSMLNIAESVLAKQLTSEQSKVKVLTDAAQAIEINAEECLDFDECTAMLIPIDDYHALIEALAAVKGE